MFCLFMFIKISTPFNKRVFIDRLFCNIHNISIYPKKQIINYADIIYLIFAELTDPYEEYCVMRLTER